MQNASSLTSNSPDARDYAIAVLRDVVFRRLALDERLERLREDEEFRALSPSDRGLTRAIAQSAVRGLGTIRHQLTSRLREGMPLNAGLFEAAMIAGIAQILFLDVPDYAAVDTTIEKLRMDRRAERYVSLANAILRAIARERDGILANLDPLAINTPIWLADRWSARYGSASAAAIARIHLAEPPLDLTVKSDPQGWADRLGGRVLANGTVRIESAGNIPDLDGFAEGQWWVQDVSASLPARILNAQFGERILDLCAAPGGKTAQLALTGAAVTAVDRSAPRLRRLEANFQRLDLQAEVHVAEAATFAADPFDAILLDAPCSATGTIRRHPDVAWSKTLADVAALAELQSRLLDRAFSLLRPGGRLIYATCSLEAEEGENQIDAFLQRTSGVKRLPISADEVAGFAEMIDERGQLRVLPSHLAEFGGADGFFSARLVKS